MNALESRRILVLLFSVTVWAGLAVLPSCAGKDEGEASGSACNSDTECKGNRVCIDGTCAYPNNGTAGVAGLGGNTSAGSSGAQVVANNDANGDGMLSPSEAPADMQAGFNQIDTNHDGVLTPAEIDQAASASSAAAGSVINIATQGASAAAQAASAVSGEICAEGQATPTRVAPKVVLLLDGSSTMGESYAGNTTRWSAMRQAILDPNAGVVSAMQGLIEFGLVVFAGPWGGGGSCPIPGQVVGPALNNYQAIEAAFPRNEPGVFTPTGQALQLVCEALPGQAQAFRPQYVVLATDGEPNACSVPLDQMTGGNIPSDFQSVIDAADFCCSKGVTIYVISLAAGGAEYQAHLQDVANLGACTGSPGTGVVYSPQDPGQLSGSLGQLMGGAVMCDVLLNGSVVQGKECQGSVVTLNGRTLGCRDANGWVLASENVIRLQGAACEEFKNNPGSAVTAEFPCEIFVPGGGPGGGGAGSGSGGGGTSGNSGGGGGTGGGPIF